MLIIFQALLRFLLKYSYIIIKVLLQNFIKSVYIFIKIDLMQQQVVNRGLHLSYQQFLKNGESITDMDFDKYSIYQQIGQGGFGKVYRGFNNQTGQIVAVKLTDINKIRSQPRERLRAIKLRLAQNEDIMMRVCTSKNLVKCYDVFQNKDLKLIFMQFCNGGSLEQLINSRGRINENEAIMIFKQILSGIAELHSHKIVHRDLKSENILIHNGIYKIADFGFSKELPDEQKTHTFLGTITNMAPQILNRQPYGLKADIWSVGVILFQMVFGVYPFDARQKDVLLGQMKQSNIYKQKRLNCNGYCATLGMTNLLKQLLVLNQEKRIGWQQLTNHPFLKIRKQGLPSAVIVDQIIICPNTEVYLQADQINYSSLIIKLKKQSDSKAVTPYKRTNKNFVPPKPQADIQYVEMNERLVECLKVDFMYREVIHKIQQYKMLDLEEREVIEFMYLLSVRCFFTISPINSYFSKNREKSQFVRQTYESVEQVYKKAKRTFDLFCDRLTEEQDRVFNRLKDFFRSKEQKTKYDNFLNGLQGKDFKKEEHLKFINEKYITPLKKQFKCSNVQALKRVQQILSNYSQINKIEYKHVKDSNFDEYIQKML